MSSNPATAIGLGMRLAGGLTLVATCALGACTATEPPRKLASSGPFTMEAPAKLMSARRATELDFKTAARLLEPLHQRKSAPGPNDWLASHREPGQSFEQYRASDPNRPTSERGTIYLQPLGQVRPQHQRAFHATTEFLARYYGLSVRRLPVLQLSNVPARARRVHPSWGDKQLLTGYLLDEILLPRRPRDAVAMLGLTTSDLYPGSSWNFVFGEASLDERIGVWSVYRYGDPSDGPEAYRHFLRRTLKVATHETGHMFGFFHCTFYECAMNGSNHLAETDASPIDLCPECLQKLWWATGVAPAARFRALAELADSLELADEARSFRASLAALEAR